MRRRTYCSLCGCAVLAGVAGCLGDGDDADDGATDDAGDASDTDGEEDADDAPDAGDDTDDTADDADDVPDVPSDGVLAFGEAGRTWNDYLLTPSAPRLADSYDYETEDGTETFEPRDGMQFAFVDVTVENDADEPRDSPGRTGFSVIVDDDQYYVMGRFTHREADMYEGDLEHDPGVIETGVVGFEIPQDLTADDLVLRHAEADIVTGAESELFWE